MIKCSSLGVKYLLIAVGLLIMVCAGKWLIDNCFVETATVEIVEVQRSWEDKNIHKGRSTITYFTEYAVIRTTENGEQLEDTVVLKRATPDQYEAGIRTVVDIHKDGTLTDHVYLPQKLLAMVMLLFGLGWTYVGVRAKVTSNTKV